MANNVIKKLLNHMDKCLPAIGAPMLNSLHDQVKTIYSLLGEDNNKNLTPAEREQVISSLSAFNKGVKEYLGTMGPETMEKEGEAYSMLFSVQNYTDFLEKNLAKGRSLQECYEDHNWMRGYFGEMNGVDITVKDPELDVPKSLLDSLKKYRDAVIRTKAGREQNIKLLTKDPLNSEMTLHFMHSFADGYARELHKQFTSFMASEGVHEKLRSQLELDSMEKLSPALILNSFLFDTELEKGVDGTTVFGNIKKGTEKVTDPALKEERISVLAKEFSKLKFLQKKSIQENGVSVKKTFNTSGASAADLQIFDAARDYLFGFLNPLEIMEVSFRKEIRKGKPLHDLYNSMKKVRDKLMVTLNGRPDAEGLQLQDIDEFADTFEAFLLNMTEQEIFDDRGFTSLFDMLFNMQKQNFSELFPERREKNERFLEQIQNRVKGLYEEHLKHILDEKADNKEAFLTLDEKLFFNSRSLLSSDLIPLDQVYQDVFLKMMADPEYNRHILEKTRDVISSFEGNQEGEAFSLNRKLRIHTDINHEKLPHNKTFGTAYKLFLLSRQLVNEHRKYDRGDKTNSAVRALREKRPLTTEDLKLGRDLFDKYSNRPEIRKITEVPVKRFVAAMKKEITPAELVHTGEPDVQKYSNLLSGIPEDMISALTEEEGVLTGNSDSYKNMKQAIETITHKNRFSWEGTTAEDYQNLYNTCSEYLLRHKGEPATTGGKKRCEAAAAVLSTLIHPMREYFNDKQPHLNNLIEVQMLHSKYFREAYVIQTEKAVLDYMKKEGFLKNGRPDSGHLNAMSEAQTKKLKDFTKILAFGKALNESDALGSKNMVNDKLRNKADFDMIVEKGQGLLESTREYMNEFLAAPAERLLELMPYSFEQLKPDAPMNENVVKNQHVM